MLASAVVPDRGKEIMKTNCESAFSLGLMRASLWASNLNYLYFSMFYFIFLLFFVS